MSIHSTEIGQFLVIIAVSLPLSFFLEANSCLRQTGQQ